MFVFMAHASRRVARATRGNGRAVGSALLDHAPAPELAMRAALDLEGRYATHEGLRVLARAITAVGPPSGVAYTLPVVTVQRLHALAPRRLGVGRVARRRAGSDGLLERYSGRPSQSAPPTIRCHANHPAGSQ